MPLPLLAALGVLGAGGLISRRSDVSGNEPGLVGGLLQDVFRSSGFASSGNRRREQGLMDERLEQEQAQQEQQARSAFMADKGLMGQGWTEGQPLESLQQQQGAYESALARNQAIAAQNMGLADRALANAKTQQEQTLARVTPIRAEYLKRVTPLQEQAAKNTAIVDMLNQGGGVAGYGATKIWLQSLDNAMVTNAEMAGAMAGTGIQERVGQILAQAEGKGFLTDPQAAELAALVEQANTRIGMQYAALNEQASAAAQAYGVDPGLITVFGELPGMARFKGTGGSSSEPVDSRPDPDWGQGQ